MRPVVGPAVGIVSFGWLVSGLLGCQQGVSWCARRSWLHQLGALAARLVAADRPGIVVGPVVLLAD
jgi:hypothetical protein